MKIIILHGENTVKSYDRLGKFIDEAKKRDWEIAYDALDVTPSLFGKDRLFVIRDYKILPKKLKNFEGTLVIYHEGDLPQTFLKNYKDSRIERYDIPKILWKFLDTPTISLLHDVLKKEPIELVFHLLAKRFRKTKYVSELAQIDYDGKTGKVDLVSSLDLFISKNLQ